MYIADLHIHSKYSRATSKDCDPEHLDLWARRKGIDIVGTGDFTHPAWREELTEKLEPAEEGLYVLKEEYRIRDGITSDEQKPRFVITGEISSIYKKNDKTRKIHNLILLPGLDAAARVSAKLETIGNIHSDGRPILGLDSRDLLEILLDISPDSILVPAHIWTPHFSLFGAFSGFDTIEECFGDLTSHIHALETGLSSDPPMNWRLSALDSFQLISNSDAHSPGKLGREANLMDIDLSYPSLTEAIQTGKGLYGTIEFFPEEGKYHFDGHRKCSLVLTPSETEQYGGICPVCGKKITIGVQHRVEQLADRGEGFLKEGAKPFESLVPLPEVIGASTGMSAAGKKVNAQFEKMLAELGPEFYILREAPLEDIRHSAGACVEEGIRRLRNKEVRREPGFDGEYGKIHLIEKEEIDAINGQMTFFDTLGIAAAQEPKKKKKKIIRQEKNAAAKPASEKKQKDTGDNEEQREAVVTEHKAVAVIAGPGTGKTKTLVDKIAYLVNERNISPSQITAVTFTNQAAFEMRERLKKRLAKDTYAKDMTIGTFHSICLNLLRQRGEEIVLADNAELLEAAEEALIRLGSPQKPKDFLKHISSYKNNIKGQESASKEEADCYQEVMKELGLADFDDLLLKVLEQTDAGPEGTGQFSYLLVDEMQDMNDIQFRLVLSWFRHGKELFVIGDPDQSIYGFRGSDARCFDRLREEIPDLKMIYLRKNYRSTPEIIGSALSVISENPGEERYLSAVKSSGKPVRVITSQNDWSEAIFIAKEINRLTGGMDMMDAQNYAVKTEKPRGFGDIAILYRTHHQARAIEKCLRQESIPCVITGQDSFLEDEKVKGTVSFFRYLLDEKNTKALSIALKSFPGCGEFLEEFKSLIHTETPGALLKLWMEKNSLTEDEALLCLGKMTLFHENMAAFLSNLLLGTEGDLKRNGEKEYTSDAVTLMTLHGSKGLEFPVVFISGVKQGSIPLESPLHPADKEEERRLFFVGMTRAKEELILITRKETSEFLSALPQKYRKNESAGKKQPEAEQLSLFDL
ncbi:UvrD-helicase domain-containing protein [Anaerostipes sp.]|uniref:UvrD-helicase domain-containing protein n=1 Tax=Anaerostipes sp. TaxID=1872530 RepID=UPI0025C29712|nr:UvrD-helicase domain-containing protein [Anaerostipes sp.]MBS7007316.1 UvrD-helicase domain-containing protein [Anaerostipes sp.]